MREIIVEINHQFTLAILEENLLIYAESGNLKNFLHKLESILYTVRPVKLTVIVPTLLVENITKSEKPLSVVGNKISVMSINDYKTFSLLSKKYNLSLKILPIHKIYEKIAEDSSIVLDSYGQNEICLTVVKQGKAMLMEQSSTFNCNNIIKELAEKHEITTVLNARQGYISLSSSLSNVTNLNKDQLEPLGSLLVSREIEEENISKQLINLKENILEEESKDRVRNKIKDFYKISKKSKLNEIVSENITEEDIASDEYKEENLDKSKDKYNTDLYTKLMLSLCSVLLILILSGFVLSRIVTKEVVTSSPKYEGSFYSSYEKYAERFLDSSVFITDSQFLQSLMDNDSDKILSSVNKYLDTYVIRVSYSTPDQLDHYYEFLEGTYTIVEPFKNIDGLDSKNTQLMAEISVKQ
jgi:hypothetical protein